MITIDINAIIEVIKTLFGVHTHTRQGVIDILKQMSFELDELANAWRRIVLHLEDNPDIYPSSELRDQLFSQGSHFAALRRFVDERGRSGILSPLRTNTGQEFFDTVKDALYIKGSLYSLIHQVVYPGEIQAESMERLFDTEKLRRKLGALKKIADIRNGDPNDSSLTESERTKLVARKRELKEWEDNASEQEKNGLEKELSRLPVREEALLSLRLNAKKLSELAGAFRTQVALY